MIRLIQNLRKESKLIVKIKKILTFNETINPQMVEEILQASNQSNRIITKITSLSIIYENLNNHRNFLADYLVLYFGAILDNFKIFKNLDYRRVLYIKKQIAKCKSLLLANIKESCPNVYKKFLDVTRTKMPDKKQRERKNEFLSKDIKDCGDVLSKKVKINSGV